MTTEFIETNASVISMVGDIVSAYVSNNHVRVADLPVLIATVHTAISSLIGGSTVDVALEPGPEKPAPAQINRSLSRDALISFIDGKPYKTLKRHLSVHGLTPDTYRAQFGLPSNYPMVTASYSERRSSLAKSMGLGIRRGRPIESAGSVHASKGRNKTT